MNIFVFPFIIFSLLIININSLQQCQWIVNINGSNKLLDLTSLKNQEILIQEQSPNNEYWLKYSPCSNSVSESCYSSPSMAAQLTSSTDTSGQGILAFWNSGVTQPTYSNNNNNQDVFTFNYPSVGDLCAAGCDGRHFIINYICDTSSNDPWNKNKSIFYETDRVNNICQYNVDLYTKYACPTSLGPTVAPTNGPLIKVKQVITTTDKSKLFAPQPDTLSQIGTSNNQNIINIYETETYQNIYGFGAALTESSSYLLLNLKNSDRSSYNSLMQKLFNKSYSNPTSFGINVLRYPISSCDFILPTNKEYTVDDTYNDYDLTQLTLQPWTKYQIPILQDIMKINPNIKLIGSPWTALPWLKNSANKPYPGNYDGGELNDNDQTYTTYAQAFLKMLEQYKKTYNIEFFGLTLQNEPLYEPSNYPGTGMPATQQIKLIQKVGPLLNSSGYGNVKIMTYDHNWDVTDYSNTVLSDSTSYQYVTGTAWHCYGGQVSAQTTIHNAFPKKEQYFTECASEGQDNFASDMQWNVNNLWYGNVINWGTLTTHWNLVLDENYGPHNGGCGNCRGTFRMDTSNNNQIELFEVIYGIGHYGKWVNPDIGAVRVGVSVKSSAGSCLTSTAFKNKDKLGNVTIIVNNFCGYDIGLGIQKNGQYIDAKIPNGITSFLW